MSDKPDPRIASATVTSDVPSAPGSTPGSVEDLSDVWLWQALNQLGAVVRRYCRGQPEGSDRGEER